MSLILDGTNGLSDVDGTAATPAIRGTDTNTGIFFPAADTIAFSEGGTEAMRIDSSGNVGINTTTPDDKLKVVASNGGGIRVGDGTVNALLGTGAGPVGRLYTITNHGFIFGTNDIERMRLNAGGDFCVGTTSAAFPTSGAPNGGFSSVGTDHIQFSKTVATSYGTAVLINRSGGVGQGSFTEYWFNGNQCGNITSNGANNVTYGTTSDYRLKDNVKPMTGSLERILNIKPVTYTWKTDNSDGQGFIAHELQQVIPSAVVGIKDEMTKYGTISPQVVDYGRLTPDLVKAIQELKATVDAQAERIVALENLSAQS
jgi:hypothetical protein